MSDVPENSIDTDPPALHGDADQPETWFSLGEIIRCALMRCPVPRSSPPVSARSEKAGGVRLATGAPPEAGGGKPLMTRSGGGMASSRSPVGLADSEVVSQAPNTGGAPRCHGSN